MRITKEEVWRGTRKELLDYYKSLPKQTSPPVKGQVREIAGLSVAKQLRKNKSGKPPEGLYKIFFIRVGKRKPVQEIEFVGQIVHIMPKKITALTTKLKNEHSKSTKNKTSNKVKNKS